MLAEYDSSANPKVSETTVNSTMDSLPISPKTETMTSLDQVRKFRLQKSPLTQKLSARDRLREKINEVEFEENESTEDPNSHGEHFQNLHPHRGQQDINGYETELTKLKQGLEKRKEGGPYNLPRQLRKEFGYSTSGSETDDENVRHTDKDQCGKTDPTTTSKELHARYFVVYFQFLCFSQVI